MTPAQTLSAALAHRHTRASFRTLDKHAARPQGIDRTSALRLLRRNVRDVAPGASDATQQRVAIALLTHWRLARNANGTDNT